jgi:hypothetical protein
MQFTNKLNLPRYIVDWLMKDNYDHATSPNTISATGLMKPLRAQVLTTRHADKLVMDVSELIASRYGSAIHDSIERIDTPGVSKEVRTFKKITVRGVEFTISGKYDLLEEQNNVHTLRDIKSTSVWAKIHGGKDNDYRAQLSIYRWLLSDTHNINPTAFIDFFFTDWQGSKAKQEPDYPQSRLSPGHPISLASVADTEKAIIRKLEAIVEYSDVPDNDLPLCTDDELWAEEEKFAVYKINNKRATKICDSKIEAERYIRENEMKDTVIQHRPGKVKRCKYCAAAPFCNQFKSLLERKMIAD